MQNAGHGLAFALLAVVCTVLHGAGDDRIGRVRWVAIALSLFALGALIELAQLASGRGASAIDLLMNAAGIVAGSAIGVAIRLRTTVAGRRGRRTVLLTAALAASWILREPLTVVGIDALAPPLPTLERFERPFALARYAGGAIPADLSLIRDDARWPSNASTMLEAVFPPGVWPGFRLIEPPSDWRAYRALTLRVVNPGKQPIRLMVRVDQRAAGEDIFRTADATLEPGENTVRIELRSMRPDVVPAERADHEPFRQVSQVLLFLVRNAAPVTLLFDDLLLARE